MAKGKGGSRAKYERYKLEQRREKNKIRKIKKYLKTHPNDLQSAKRVIELESLLRK